jgi:hypothetical protein
MLSTHSGDAFEIDVLRNEVFQSLEEVEKGVNNAHVDSLGLGVEQALVKMNIVVLGQPVVLVLQIKVVLADNFDHSLHQRVLHHFFPCVPLEYVFVERAENYRLWEEINLALGLVLVENFYELLVQLRTVRKKVKNVVLSLGVDFDPLDIVPQVSHVLLEDIVADVPIVTGVILHIVISVSAGVSDCFVTRVFPYRTLAVDDHFVRNEVLDLSKIRFLARSASFADKATY